MKEVEFIFQELYDSLECITTVMYQLTKLGQLYDEPQIGTNSKYYSVYLNIEKDIHTISEIFNIIKSIKEVHDINFTIVALDNGTLDVVLTYIDKSDSIKLSKLDKIYNELVKNHQKSEYDGKVIKWYHDIMSYKPISTYITSTLESFKRSHPDIEVLHMVEPTSYMSVYYLREM